MYEEWVFFVDFLVIVVVLLEEINEVDIVVVIFLSRVVFSSFGVLEIFVFVGR